MNLKGKIIVITGVDASGKETHTRLLESKLSKAKRISFPNYDSPTGRQIKNKLATGMVPNRISTAEDRDTVMNFAKLYTADRRYSICSNENLKYLFEGGIIICDRYSESNLVHQATKIVCEDPGEQLVLRREFEKEILHYEHEFVKVPKPDLVIYLGLKFETVKELLIKRGELLDAHESDDKYLKECIANGLRLCEDYGYKYVNCEDENGLRSIEDINQELFEIITNFINTTK